MMGVKSVYAVRASVDAQPFIALGNLPDALKIVNAMHGGDEGYDYIDVWKYVVELPVFGSFEVVEDE